MEKIIVVIDASLHFTLSFSDYINERKILPYPVMAFTEWTAYCKCRAEYDTKLAVISDSFRESAEKDLPDCPILWLSDKPTNTEQNILNRYQDAEHIGRAMTGCLSGMEEDNSHKALSRLTIVYSPSGGVGKTSCALAYASYVGKKSRALYVNLEEYSSLHTLFGEADFTLTDALMYYLEASQECAAHIMSCFYSSKDFDYIAPSRCPVELEELESDQLYGFIQLLREGNWYDEIVLDCGSIIKQPWRLLNAGDRILLPLQADNRSCMEKYDAFMQYVVRGKYPHLKDKLVTLTIPFRSEWQGKAITLDRLGATEYIRAIKGAGL